MLVETGPGAVEMENAASAAVDGARWVFGYGSLIWNPGFRFRRARPALLAGAHRSLCIYSHNHRGTPEQPGLVFGLLPGGSCRGMAFEVGEEDWDEVYDYLVMREQVSGVYREALRPVRFDEANERAVALTFLVDPAHVQFAGRLGLAEQTALVRAAAGEAGHNLDYVRNTAHHLAELGIKDRQLVALIAHIEAELARAEALEDEAAPA